jgi:glycosyltransferase involved in cell wall biosynthesis
MSAPNPPAGAALPRVSVLLSTFNHPDLLARSLLGFALQSTRDFEVVVADDGSGPDTRKVVETFQADYPVPLRHVWQPDRGFHKSRAVNRATLQSRGVYLLFSDGDCVPSPTLIAEHLAVARPGHYVVGGFIRLSEEQSAALGDADVRAGNLERFVTPAQWLDLYFTHLKSLVYIALNKSRKPKIYGLNFSLHRDDFVRVNGYDETYHNSAKEDSDLRNRMQVAGLRAISLWHRPGVFHQHHPPHEMRIAWREAHAYYNRRDLPAEAPVGLRELQNELFTSTNAL